MAPLSHRACKWQGRSSQPDSQSPGPGSSQPRAGTCSQGHEVQGSKHRVGVCGSLLVLRSLVTALGFGSLVNKQSLVPCGYDLGQ